ncbi:MAG: tRNA pseudouridine(55) synthase [Bacteroidales bacterium]|nr:tRNA pseudouridine(55) synthase [Bacteroidales bacterium]
MVVIDKNFNGILSRDINDYPEGIVMVIDKPYRWTSADVIRKVKYAAIRHFCKKNLKVGHAGTLDPLATGVLLVCIGNACKRAQEFQDTGKEYVAGVCFGATTPSYDLEKDIDRTFPTDGVSAETINAVLPEFLGAQDQVAPLFSAKQVDGVRAYELARKLYRSGQPLDEAAKEILQINSIDISELELLGLGLSTSSAKAESDQNFRGGTDGLKPFCSGREHMDALCEPLRDPGEKNFRSANRAPVN